MPGIIWFYYGSEEYKCKSSKDDNISSMIIWYFVVSLLLIIPLIKFFFDHYEVEDCVEFLPSIYFIGKFIIKVIMIINIHTGYISETVWDKNLCPNLESLTLFWLIWNYINISLTFIYFIIYICIIWCKCSYYEDLDCY